MTAPEGMIDTVALHLSSTDSRNDLAVPLLCRHLGITPDDARHRLSMPGILATDLHPAAARRLRDMLAVLGLRVSIQDQGEPARIDMSLQLAVWADVLRIADRVGAILGRDPQAVAAAMSRPGGLLLAGLDHVTAQQLHTGLRALRGLVVLQSDCGTALHDIYCTRHLTEEEISRLEALRQLFGLYADPLTEAIACGLDSPNRDAFLSRAAGLDLLSVDRRFQRFDLVLTGAAGWTSSDLADFLVSRTQKPRSAFEQLSPESPLTLDLGLKERIARQFCGDYASIGLLVRPVLSARSGNP